MTLNRAIDLFLGELARRGRTEETQRTYQRFLFAFSDYVGEKPLAQISVNDFRTFIDRWRHREANTQNIVISAMRGLFTFLVDEGELMVSPMARIARRPRKRPEDLPLVTVSAEEVERMFAVCEDWQELLCLSVLAYCGARRRAVARVRWRDVDLAKATITFHEKGGKVAVKPIPDELLAILRAAVQGGEVDTSESAYVVPNRRTASVRAPSEAQR